MCNPYESESQKILRCMDYLIEKVDEYPDFFEKTSFTNNEIYRIFDLFEKLAQEVEEEEK